MRPIRHAYSFRPNFGGFTSIEYWARIQNFNRFVSRTSPLTLNKNDMLVQTIKRLSVYGSNAEYSEMAPNVWMIVFHDIDFELRASMYAGTKVCTSEAEAETEAKAWLEQREAVNEYIGME